MPVPCAHCNKYSSWDVVYFAITDTEGSLLYPPKTKEYEFLHVEGKSGHDSLFSSLNFFRIKERTPVYTTFLHRRTEDYGSVWNEFLFEDILFFHEKSSIESATILKGVYWE